MRRRPNLFFMLLTGLMLPACASHNEEAGAQPAPSEGPVRVNVRNDAFSQATIYLVRQDETRRRLGTISPVATATFTLPQYLTEGESDLKFEVELLGAPNDKSSRTVLVAPREVIELTIR